MWNVPMFLIPRSDRQIADDWSTGVQTDRECLEAERVQHVVHHTRICLQRVDVKRIAGRIAADGC